MKPTIQYIGENLLPGQLGHTAIMLAFVAALLATFAFFMATQRRNDTPQYTAWRRVGRWAFFAQGIGVLTAMGCIFYVLIEHRYEYNFAFKVVNEQLPFKYIFSAFWQEQEGSFLLWMFWHTFFGGLLVWRAKEWETPVMASLMAIQLCLLTMILGLYFPWGTGEFRIGSNPLMLLRDAMANAPIFNKPDYLAVIKGRGLNPLLQNWWMTIHPPTLFYGFASTSLPFCYAVAGLWTGQHREWIRPATPWALMSLTVLGVGIFMGGAWAYEALSFGGYWAWDPVENMSLVPWLILAAAVHSLLIARATGRAIKSAYIFSMLTFLLIVYSTFLTRSGILGDTSVHAFTEMGLEWQLVGFLGIFSALSVVLLARNYRAIPELETEESIYSKEFWIFIGTLILLFSAILITFTSSIPVYNKLLTFFGDKLHFDAHSLLRRPPVDPIEHYNKFQIWVGILMALVSGVAQFMRFRTEKPFSASFIKHVSGAFAASLLLGLGTAYLASLLTVPFVFLLVSSFFVIFSNTDYIVTVLKSNLKMVGSALSHIGFGLLFLGALFSGAKKEQISADSFMKVSAKGVEGFTEDDAAKNVLLYKGLPTQMSAYELTYQRDTIDGFTRTFTVHYKKRKDKSEKSEVLEEFDLHPNVLYTLEKDKVAASNPSTKHYWYKDVFTHVVSLPIDKTDPMQAQHETDTLSYKQHELAEGDTMFTSKNYIVYKNLEPATETADYKPKVGDIAVTANLEVRNIENNEVVRLNPRFVIRDNMGIGSDAISRELGLHVRFDKIDGYKKKIFLSIAQSTPKTDFLVLSAIVFPGINLVWLGCTIMFMGIFIAMLVRLNETKTV